MKEKDARPTYEPPTARDISSDGLSSGDSDMCRDGLSPLQKCNQGHNFGDECITGSNYAFPVCMQGTLALSNCHSGDGQGF